MSATAYASFDSLIVVAVPMENGDEGAVELRYVTYLVSLGSASPGIEIRYTCSPAPVAVDRTSRAKVDSLHVEEANAAHESGLTIQIEDRLDPGSWNSPHSSPIGARWGNQRDWPQDGYVDTLAVELNTTTAYERAVAAGNGSVGMLDAVVRSTLDCIRDNASRSDVSIHHVKLVITGPERYRKLGGLMRITPRPDRGTHHLY